MSLIRGSCESRGRIGVQVSAYSLVGKFCDPAKARWTFRATVYRNRSCKGFVGFGDADPSNVSSLVSGAEMRVAETRAVNRALRKAYGIDLCSVEEISSSPSLFSGTTAQSQKGKLPSGNGQPLLRDRLRQLIVQHQLDPVLVKAYALDFCGAKTLAEASREQIESFVQQLATKAQTDLKELRGLLDGYGPRQEVA